MKKVFVLAMLPFLFFACVKTSAPCTNVTPASEEPQILAYCGANGISYSKDPSGIYYQIIDPGTNPHPTITSIVSTTYTGKLLNGVVIDSSSTALSFALNQLVVGWQIGLQFIGKGGHIKMVVPSSLCYGCNGALPTVPGNSILYFDITLVDVK